MKGIGSYLPYVQFGGNANEGSNAGFGYSNTNNAPTNANANNGSQLSYMDMDGR